MRSELDVGSLHTDRATSVDDHPAHLRDSAHPTHWLVWFWQHVVLARHRERAVEQDRHTDPADPLELARILRRVAVDDVDISLLTERVRRLLQLTELLNTEVSSDAHVEDQHYRLALARRDRVALPFRIGQHEGWGRLADQRVDVLSHA